MLLLPTLISDVVYRVDCKGCDAFCIGETRKAPYSRMREHQGGVRRRETTSLIWIHTAETHSFAFENVKAIDHGRFKDERLVKEAVHSGPQALNRCVSLPVQYQAIQIRTIDKKARQIQAGEHVRTLSYHIPPPI